MCVCARVELTQQVRCLSIKADKTHKHAHDSDVTKGNWNKIEKENKKTILILSKFSRKKTTRTFARRRLI